MVVRGCHLEHTSKGKTDDKNKLANVLWVANYCEDGLRNIKLSRPIDVFTTIKRKFGINISYWTAWNAWTICCSGDDTTLQWIGTMVMFKASFDGWLRGCRPVLGLDGCFLKGKYGGVCLSLIGLDGNNTLFLVAIYLCRSECYNTWNTFIQALQPWLVQHDTKLAFISDRQKGLIKAVADNFHHCNHRFCFRHMYKNFKNIIGVHIWRRYLGM
ncbi:hypothetical protein GIB67_016418 [Kingdonia uniflora]|uniref:MULE transposase domain-containing protein n=1 Tax=Kingdonia uniflora TaxID=39325 RepID=A0A7J7MH13_9MAGN|nr:hypothetical protein GIB67_016418 [Kingdonia uniflora]